MKGLQICDPTAHFQQNLLSKSDYSIELRTLKLALFVRIFGRSVYFGHDFGHILKIGIGTLNKTVLLPTVASKL